ncbi:hypothetical protein ACFLX5_05200 [Chloroflexota bacterium]
MSGEERPLTREDVLRLIETNGGTAEGLDLPGKVFEEGIDLAGLGLSGIILKSANLFEANLENAYLGLRTSRGQTWHKPVSRRQ